MTKKTDPFRDAVNALAEVKRSGVREEEILSALVGAGVVDPRALSMPLHTLKRFDTLARQERDAKLAAEKRIGEERERAEQETPEGLERRLERVNVLVARLKGRADANKPSVRKQRAELEQAKRELIAKLEAVGVDASEGELRYAA
jgi:hypothetical protein